MKWNNRGHEFDDIAIELIDEKNGEMFYVFGAGKIGLERYKALSHFNMLKGFIDNDCSKQNNKIENFSIISLDDYCAVDAKNRIVICAGEKIALLIKKQLEEKGLVYRRDFFLHNEFFEYYFPIYLTYKRKQMYLEMTQLSLTERCTLKCEKCAHGCFNVPIIAEDVSYETMVAGIDLYFSKVDFVKEFALIGGEPLLASSLCSVISYINDNYRDKIDVLSITTNGTIMPSEQLIALCKSSFVLFRISNYSLQIPNLIKNYERLVKILDENKLQFIMSEPEKDWWDYGFEDYDRGSDEKILRQTFSTCKTICKELRGNTLYACIMARCINENLFHRKDEIGYNLGNTDDNKIFLEACLGFSGLGYMKTCQYCRGAEAVNYVVPAAVQK